MSIFPRSFITQNEYSIPPIIRLLDEYDRYSRNIDHPSDENNQRYRSRDRYSHHVKPFCPKFDIKELPDTFELYGELPGIDQKDVDIEFTDASTLTIKGRIERNYTGEHKNVQKGSESSSKPVRKATVEDESTSQGKTVSLTNKKVEDSKTDNKFWVMERDTGDFSRTFTFPVQVDQLSVKATMKNGILSVFVPKRWKKEGRKITIQ